jgi:hypothetical protein
MAELPWNRALLEANQKQASRVAELEVENRRLKVTIANLRRRLDQARHVHANWLLRQQAWRAERDDLLRRLALADPTPHPSIDAYRNWGPGS